MGGCIGRMQWEEKFVNIRGKVPRGYRRYGEIFCGFCLGIDFVCTRGEAARAGNR